jgi:hypothetical protein
LNLTPNKSEALAGRKSTKIGRGFPNMQELRTVEARKLKGRPRVAKVGALRRAGLVPIRDKTPECCKHGPSPKGRSNARALPPPPTSQKIPLYTLPTSPPTSYPDRSLEGWRPPISEGRRLWPEPWYEKSRNIKSPRDQREPPATCGATTFGSFSC